MSFRLSVGTVGALEHLSFALSQDFVDSYAEEDVPWGFPIGGGNRLGLLVYLEKYSRLKDDGTKEHWHETCARVINGMYSILKDHCAHHRTTWNAQKAHRSAEEAFDRMFQMKWLPPGRGLWMMGTEFVTEHGSAALLNCAFLSTSKLGPRNPTAPFCRLMEMSMLGIGVGFDTDGAGELRIFEPHRDFMTVEIEDSREGWVNSVDTLLRAYLTAGQGFSLFDYSQIRAAGEAISGFGGTAAGPEPLKRLHEQLRALFAGRANELLSVTDIVDIMNLIGKCVVAGNVRRSAEIALGTVTDKEFLNLKNWEVNPVRCGPDGWAHLSNNSVITEVGTDHDHLVDLIATNGEPGLYYRDLARNYGRLIDPPTDADRRVRGINPCAEQPLEDQELCTLVETFPTNHTDLADFKRTLKYAYLYGKAVTLLPTHWAESNEVMGRNRRIGCSVSGLAQFAERHGTIELRRWLNQGYDEVRERDRNYSEWLGVRESVKVTTVKPSGTVSLLAGVWPGVHWSENEYHLRRMRFRRGATILTVLETAGYHVEPDVMDPEHTMVATFPCHGPAGRSTRDVSVWEKVTLAILAQRYWADNAVSATFTFSAEERDQIGPLLRAFDGQLKSLSFLPMSDDVYPQMPYERSDAETYDAETQRVRKLRLASAYRRGEEAQGENFCANDRCEVRI